MFKYNPAFPPRCRSCGGNTKELKRAGDSWVWLKCNKCCIDYCILDERPAVNEKGDAWEELKKEEKLPSFGKPKSSMELLEARLKAET